MANVHHCDIESILQSVAAQWPYRRWQQYNVLVAVSGGRDSVALLRTLVAIGQSMEEQPGNSVEAVSSVESAHASRLVVAHFNHQLRGKDSERDQEFVQRLAEEMQLECHVGSATVSNEGNVSSSSSENMLRDQRYNFLVDIARKTHCRYIATAHHAGDQAETVLFRIVRGTGVSGLAGIPPTRLVDDSLTIVRPMLYVDPAQIDAAMRQWNQPFRTDVSNASSAYSRNFLRNEVLPMLRQRFGEQVDSNINRLARQAGENQSFISSVVAELLPQAIERQSPNRTVLNCDHLVGAAPVVLRELFAEIFRNQNWPMEAIGFRELDRLAEIATSGSDVAKFQLPGGVNCFLQSGFVYLERESSRR